jgi:hypothetical protein
MTLPEIIASALCILFYLWMAVQWAIYLAFWNGFMPLALVWPVLQMWVWIKGDPHRGGF